ncbi:hypothetical protein ACIHDR_46040 [Nocardia sp. NPDC052278]|uniref:hypothetical protein n=1 Tax=unclassified Nocardia TaxID=2637762 RepID=UPI0036B76252
MAQRTRLILIGAIAATAVIMTAIISRTDSDTAESPTPAGDAGLAVHGPQPEGAGPQTAAVQALTAMFSWQPVSDPSPGAALTRARLWLTGELALVADSPPATGIREQPGWSAWRRSGDILTATANVDGAGEHTDLRVNLTATVTQTVLHRDGTTTTYRELRITATVLRTNHGWRLAAYHASNCDSGQKGANTDE